MKARNALRIFRHLDSIFNNGRLTDVWGKFLYARAFSEYDRSYDLRLLGNYKIHDSLLARISSKCGTDKGGPFSPEENYANFYHTYTDFYELLFSSRRDEIHLVFECGIGSNDSSVVGNFRFWNEWWAISVFGMKRSLGFPQTALYTDQAVRCGCGKNIFLTQ